MLITLDNSSAVPLYQQIVDQVRGKILAGELQPGEPLPSIRQLAADLLISVITTKRAYQELEAEGLIQTRPGRGTFVGEVTADYRRRAGLQEVEGQLQQAVRTAARVGVGRAEVEELFSKVVDEEFGSGSSGGGRDGNGDGDRQGGDGGSGSRNGGSRR